MPRQRALQRLRRSKSFCGAGRIREPKVLWTWTAATFRSSYGRDNRTRASCRFRQQSLPFRLHPCQLLYRAWNLPTRNFRNSAGSGKRRSRKISRSATLGIAPHSSSSSMLNSQNLCRRRGCLSCRLNHALLPLLPKVLRVRGPPSPVHRITARRSETPRVIVVRCHDCRDT